MIDYLQLLLMGAVAGFTIFLGLPVALLRNVSRRVKSFLNAVSIGILLFLVVDVLSNAWTSVKDTAISAYSGQASSSSAIIALLTMFLGVGLGLFMLTFYEGRYAKRAVMSTAKTMSVAVSRDNQSTGGRPDNERMVLQQQQAVELHGNPYSVATMIAMSIGLHNFAEGLAIGQSYASAKVALAILLVVGFAVHNATEGFGIASPLAAVHERPSLSFLVRMGLIGGGPTFLGTIVGSLVVSTVTYVLFLSLAAGALIYVSLLLYASGRRHVGNDIMMIGIFVGVLAGFLTDLIVSLGGL